MKLVSREAANNEWRTERSIKFIQLSIC